MGLLSRPKADTSDQTPQAEEEGDTREIRVTVFPTGGGRPYIRDVEVEDGTFELNDNHTVKIARGSVWQEGSTERAIASEHEPTTINVEAIEGDDLIDARTMNGIVNNNLWMQLDEINSRKGVWQQSSTWVMIALAASGLLLGLWLVKTTGDGFETLAEAMRQMQFAAESGSHQDISPEG